jgi:hypothetical protein
VMSAYQGRKYTGRECHVPATNTYTKKSLQVTQSTGVSMACVIRDRGCKE